VEGDVVRARTVANQIAVQKACEAHGLKKVFSFHRNVASARDFTGDSSSSIKVLLPDYRAYHVNGGMRTSRREKQMSAFREADCAIMSNARCLTEGVDVPAVDVVAFLSPRKSKVDIVQAAGRAMRKADGKETGYILLPLFVETQANETIEEALERTDFEEAWDVLQAMQEQDAVLADIIREMRAERGRRGGFDDSRLRESVEVLGPKVSLDVGRIRGCFSVAVPGAFFRPPLGRRASLDSFDIFNDHQLLALKHDAIANTSRFEDYQEPTVIWAGALYHCENSAVAAKLAPVDLFTPCDMRAPGAAVALYALESAMDELSYAAGVDPLELRLRNYSDLDQNTDKPFSSKALKDCYYQGAQRFGWSKRKREPRSMREGRELVGYGMATGIWEALRVPTSARAVLSPDGSLEIGCATADIGTGTYTILAQIAAETLGLPMNKVAVKIGDSHLPFAPVEGGSWTAASAGSAVMEACDGIRKELLKRAGKIRNAPLKDAGLEDVIFADGEIRMRSDPSRSMALTDILHGLNEPIRSEVTSKPDANAQKRYSYCAHSAVFAEVRLDEELGMLRVERIVSAVAAGRILNPKTARSQILGAVVGGIGMALHEETVIDHRCGRFINHNFAEYHVPVHADVHDIDVIFVEEREDHLNLLGIKGEIGIVGTAAAIANAAFHATGIRVRDLPITIDKILGLR
jgi:hypothetical protein